MVLVLINNTTRMACKLGTMIEGDRQLNAAAMGVKQEIDGVSAILNGHGRSMGILNTRTRH